MDSRKLIIKDDEVRFKRAAFKPELLGFAAAYISCIINGAFPHPYRIYDERACRFGKVAKLLERVVTLIIIHADENRSFRFRFLNGLCGRTETIVRSIDFCYQCMLGQLMRTQRPVYQCFPCAGFLVRLSEIRTVKLRRMTFRNSEGCHCVQLHRTKGTYINIGEPSVAARMSMYAAHSAQPVLIADKTHARHADLAAVAYGDIDDFSVARDIDRDLSVDLA